MIRNDAKAVILNEQGQVLLVKAQRQDGSLYYTLPGGGQEMYETLEEAVQRECMEEAGLAVAVKGFLALHEEITNDQTLRALFPNYTHRISHIFLCSPIASPIAPSSPDKDQVGCEWIPVELIAELPLEPIALRKNLSNLVKTGCTPCFLGSDRI